MEEKAVGVRARLCTSHPPGFRGASVKLANKIGTPMTRALGRSISDSDGSTVPSAKAPGAVWRHTVRADGGRATNLALRMEMRCV